MSIERFEGMVARNPGNPLFRFSLSKALCDAGEWERALPHLEVCCASRADWMLPRILKGRGMLALGRGAEARPILEEALRLARDQGHDDPAAEIEDLLGNSS
jgi:predicted Zn-dependent protease